MPNKVFSSVKELLKSLYKKHFYCNSNNAVSCLICHLKHSSKLTNTNFINTVKLDEKMDDKVKDRVVFYESLNKNTDEMENKPIKNKPLEDNLSHLEGILMVDKFKRKYLEERGLRFKLRNQIKEVLNGKEDSNCVKPSQLTLDVEVKEEKEDSLANKYLK